MNDIAQRLQDENRLVKIQAVSKLVNAVSNHFKSTPVFNISSELPEVTLLWQTLGSNDLIAAYACADALCNWVDNGSIEIQQLLSKLISVASVAQNLNGIVKAVSQLLYAVVVSDQVVSFSISRPAHPFSSLLISRPDMWHSLLENALELLNVTHDNSFDRTLSMLDPFFKLVLVEPTKTISSQPLRHGLASMSSQMESGSLKQIRMMIYLLDIICLMQNETPVHAAETVVILQNIGNSLMSVNCAVSEVNNVAAIFFDYSLSISLHLLNRHTDVHQLLSLVSRVMDKHTVVRRHFIIQCMELLLIAPSNHLMACLNIVIKVLTVGNDSLLISMLLLPLLNLPGVSMDCPDRLYQSLLVKVIDIVIQNIETQNPQNSRRENCDDGRSPESGGDGLRRVESPLSLNEECNQSRSVHQHGSRSPASQTEYRDEITSTLSPTDKRYEDRPLMSPTVETYSYQVYHKLCAAFDSVNIEQWLDEVENSLSSAQSFVRVHRHITCLVAAIFVRCQTLTSVQKSLAVLRLICSRDASQSVLMLPLIMFKLKHCSDPEVLITILKSAPTLSLNKIALGALLVTCKSLASSPKITPVSLRVMSVLWQNHDVCFPYFVQIISSSARLSHVDKDECLLARASCIFDVCSSRPEQHGSDMLPLLTNILSESVADKHSTSACLAVSALTCLCDAQVIGVRTTWTGIAKKISQDKRPPVLASLCQLLSIVPLHMVDTKDHQMFVDEVVNWLWQSTRHIDQRVVTSAFQALSAFPSSLFCISHFPCDMVDGIIIKGADQPEDVEVDVPGTVYVRLLESVPSGALAGCEVLLSSLVKQEVLNLPRGMSYAANKKQIMDNEELNLRRLSAVAVNYHYLPHTSVLRSLFDVLLEASKQDVPSRNKEILKIVLRSVTPESSCALPPIQWSHWMTRLMQLYTDAEIQVLCLKLALQQSEYQNTAALFVSSYLKSCTDVPACVQQTLAENLTILAKSTSVTILNQYIEKCLTKLFGNLTEVSTSEEISLCRITLKGCEDALQYSMGNNANVYQLLLTFIREICVCFPNNRNALWKPLSDCFHHIPDNEVFDLLSNVIQPKNALLHLYLTGSLVASGQQPLTLLNLAIESFVTDAHKSVASFCIWKLIQVFVEAASKSPVSTCLQWLLELMGHIKNVASRRVTISGSNSSASHVLNYLMLVYSAAVLAWSTTPIRVLLGPPRIDSIQGFLPFENHKVFREIVMDLMPESLSSLLRIEAWRNIRAKTIDFLIAVHCSPVLVQDLDMKNFIKNCLHGLRHIDEFQQSTVWGRAFML